MIYTVTYCNFTKVEYANREFVKRRDVVAVTHKFRNFEPIQEEMPQKACER